MNGILADGAQATADTQQPPVRAVHSSSKEDLAISHGGMKPEAQSPLSHGHPPAMGASMAATEGDQQENAQGQRQQLHEAAVIGEGQGQGQIEGQPPSSPVYLPGTPTGKLSLALPTTSAILALQLESMLYPAFQVSMLHLAISGFSQCCELCCHLNIWKPV